MKQRSLFVVMGIIISVCMAVTPFYGVGFLVAICIGSLYLTVFKGFRSYFSRMIFSGMLLGASVMFSGLIVWLIKVPLHPLISLFMYAVFIMLVQTRSAEPVEEKGCLIDKGDVIAVLIAVIAPAILLASYSVSPSSMMRIAAEGWDNGSHVLMLEDVSARRGYVYGTFESLKEVIIQKTNAYPQAWHLATSHLFNGFSVNLFDPVHMIRSIYAYVLVALCWMFVTCYLFTKTSWCIAETFVKRKLSKSNELFVFCAVNILIQMVVIWGAFVSGFSNYIGMIAYVCLLVAAMTNDFKKNHIAVVSASLIFAVAAALCWFLPGPAIIVMATLLLPLLIGINSRKAFIEMIKQNYCYPIIVFFSLSAVVMQVLIFVIFSTVGGSEQLNEGVVVSGSEVVNGVFPVSGLFFAVVALFVLAYWSRSELLNDRKRKIVLLCIIPMIILSIGLYLYQYITSGVTSYYLPKLMGVALVPIGMFSAIGFTYWMFDVVQKRFKLSSMYGSIFAVVIIGIILIGGNQSLFGGMKLLETNSRIGRPTAEALVYYLRTADHSKVNVIVLRNNPDRKYEDANGKFESRVVHQPLNCSYNIIGNKYTFEERLNRLAKCADKLAKDDRQIVVITSDRTKEEVKQLNKDNIVIKNVKNDN